MIGLPGLTCDPLTWFLSFGDPALTPVLCCGEPMTPFCCLGDLATPFLCWGEVRLPLCCGDEDVDPSLPGSLLGEAVGVGVFEDRDEDDVGCLLCPDPLLPLPICFLGEVEETEEVRVEVDLAGWGFLVGCWDGVRCLYGLGGTSRGSLDALEVRVGLVPGAGGLALAGRGRRLGGVWASLLEPDREAVVAVPGRWWCAGRW